MSLFSFGAEEGNVIAPNLTLNAPVDYYNSTTNSVTFNCSATDDKGVFYIKLYIDGLINVTLTNSSAAQNISLQTAAILIDGFHNWSCQTSDGETVITSDNRTFMVDTLFPTIDYGFGTPANNANLSSSFLYINTSWV